MNKAKGCQYPFWHLKFSILIIVTLLTCQAYNTTLAEELSADNSTNQQTRIKIRSILWSLQRLKMDL